MKLRFDIWGFLPAIYRKSSDSWGHAAGPIVSLPVDASESLLRHEQFHVKQWYVYFLMTLVLAIAAAVATPWIGLFSLLAAVPIIGAWWHYNRDESRINREHTAYGESIRIENPQTGKHLGILVDHFAKLLDTDKTYDYINLPRAEHKKNILRRYKDRKLF